MKYDHLVIGAGVSGISTALLLARFGGRVALLEQAARPAPLIDGFVRNGVYFEAGFHYAGGLEAGGVLDRHLRLLGVADDLQRVAFDPQAYDTVIQPDSGLNFSFPQGYDALCRRLQQQFPKQSRAVADYLERLRHTAGTLPYFNSHEAISPLDLAALHDCSLQQVFTELGIGGNLRTLLQVHCLLYGARPAEIPFAIHAGVVDGYYRSASTFKGGGRSLVKAFSLALKRFGVDLFCGCRVTGIDLTAADNIAGVSCADGRQFAAANYISSLHPQAMLKLVPDKAFRPVYRRRLNALAETTSGDIVFLRCQRPAGMRAEGLCESHLLAGHNYFFLPPSSADILDLTLSPQERLLYLNFAGSGGFSEGRDCGITAILPALPKSAADNEALPRQLYAEKKAMIGELVCGRIAKLLPELAGLQVECVATTKTLRRINLSPRGSLYGVKHMVGQFNPVPRTRLADFYLTGQAVAAPGLLGAITSALLAVAEIVGPDQLQKLRSEVACDV